MTKNEIFEAVLTLSIQDKKELRARLNHLLSNEGDSNETFLSLFYSELSKELTSRTKQRFPYLAVFKKMNRNSYDKLIKASNFLEKFISNLFSFKLKRTEKQKFIVMSIEIVLNYVENSPNIPLTLNNLLNNWDKLPFLLSQQFPGYIESGLIELIFKESI